MHMCQSQVIDRVGAPGFDQYVTAAVRRRNALNALAELVAELEAEHGLPADDLVLQAAAEWPD